ncbi:MAG TPA: hypothetical protein ENK55_03370 [Actinobacteria bacterium]|nr:hypothetical protein [Actinomycetota bacterium]
MGGEPGLWIEGRHLLGLVDAAGRRFVDEPRVVGNTLVLRRADLTIRIESGLGLDEALELAGRLVPAR